MLQQTWKGTTHTKNTKSPGVLAEGSCDQPKLWEILYFWCFWYSSMLFATSELVFLIFWVRFYSFATFMSELVVAHSKTNIAIQIVVKSIESMGSGNPT